jgi:hypothetical protein
VTSLDLRSTVSSNCSSLRCDETHPIVVTTLRQVKNAETSWHDSLYKRRTRSATHYRNHPLFLVHPRSFARTRPGAIRIAVNSHLGGRARDATLNPLTHAIKFTPLGGSITIRIGWTRWGGPYQSIRDTGPGIPPDEIPSVLSSFGRDELAHKDAEKGRVSGCRSSRDWSSCTAENSASTRRCAAAPK